MMELVFSSIERHNLTICLWLHTSNDPPQNEWDEACARVASLKAKRPDGLGRMRQLIVSDGASPNQKQRAQLLAGIFDKQPVKSAVVTRVLDNAIKRGVARAITWLNPGFRAFPPEQTVEALAHLDLQADAAIFAELDRLQLVLGQPNETLRLAKQAIGKN